MTQATRDALADAETLRMFQRDPFPPHLLLCLFAPDAYAAEASEVGALRCGVDPAIWARGHFYETEWALAYKAGFLRALRIGETEPPTETPCE